MVVFLDSGSEITDCVRDGGQGTAYECDITELEPGTLYRLRIVSRTDGERRDVSLQTGILQSGRVFLGRLRLIKMIVDIGLQ